ncbi:MAG: 4-hydroxy-tetrahydrodipicolinate synthase [Pseudomonadales bacterium]|jgi:4-hydroxy-tetrahydrodipicolinate synthase|nr:4-hydroxy-tetrahydrodipicolinate synthase [Pseudomonadales bacterium]
MFSGSIVALVTPMHASGNVDWAALERLIELHAANGTAAIVSVGTTGESATLSVEEHGEVIRHSLAAVAGRMPVIAGTGGNATAEAIELTALARDLGASACLLVTPYYNKPTQEGLYQHFRTIAEAVDIPQILYNVPGRTGCDMLNDTVLRLCELPNIVGIKDATGNLERGRDLLARCPADFAVYSGDDATAAELMLAGGRGNISVTANVDPARIAALCRAALAGDAARTRALDAELAEINRVLFIESNPIPVKWALLEMGLIGPGIRLPLTPLSTACQAPVRKALLDLGLLAAREA